MQPQGGLTLRSFARHAVPVMFLVSLASCGGSSSETPPPLEPLPVNLHYSRAATTLPGELGTAVKQPPGAEGALPAEEPEEPEPPAKPAPSK